MAAMSKEVQELFAKVPCAVLATASADAQPNANIIGMKKVIDDQTIYLSDQFFNKTLANLRENDKVAVVFWEGKEAYQIHGTATYVSDGNDFEEQRAWADAMFERLGAPIKAKGGVFVRVEAVYSSASGPDAGRLL